MSNPISRQASEAANRIGVKVWETESSFPTSYAESIIQHAIDSAIAEREKEQWRPVTERPKDGLYIVRRRDGTVWSAMFTTFKTARSGTWCGAMGDVTHWRELPTPPEVK